MSDFFFVLKTLMVTVVVVLLMQIRWDSRTIEDHTMTMLTSSAVVQPLNNIASSAVRLIRNTWSRVTKSINTNFSNALREENQPGSRQKNFSIERSKEILQEKATAAREAASEWTREQLGSSGPNSDEAQE